MFSALPDGRHVVIGVGRTVEVWDVLEGRCRVTYPGALIGVNAVDPLGRYLVCYTGVVCFCPFDAPPASMQLSRLGGYNEQQAITAEFSKHVAEAVRALESKQLAVAAKSYACARGCQGYDTDARTKALYEQLLPAMTRTRIACIRRVRDLMDGTGRLRHNRSENLDLHGSRLACLQWNVVGVLDLPAGKRVWELSLEQAPAAISLLPSGKHLAVAGDRSSKSSIANMVQVWDIEAGTLVCSFKDHRSPVTALTRAQEDGQFVTGDKNGEIRLWDVGLQKCIRTFEGRPGRDVKTLTYVSGLNRLCVTYGYHNATGASFDLQPVDVFDFDTGSLVQRSPCLKGAPKHVVVDSSRRALIMNSDRHVEVFDLSSGKVIFGVEAPAGVHKSGVFKGKPYWPGLEGLVATPDGRFAIFLQTGQRSEPIGVYALSLVTGQFQEKLAIVTDPETRNYPLAMTSDGRFLIGDGGPGLVMWEIEWELEAPDPQEGLLIAAKQEAAHQEQKKARQDAEAKARREAEDKARREAEDKARREAEAKAEAEAAARREAEEKAKKAGFLGRVSSFFKKDKG